MRPDEDFAMDWEVDGKAEKRHQGHRRGGQGRRPALSSRPTPTARARRSPGTSGRCCSQRKALKGVDVKRVIFNEITKPAVLDAVAHPRELDQRAGRRLSGPPRARLSGRLHPLAGAVAQAAGQPLGRPRAVGGAAPDLRARSRDRGLQAARILDGRRRVPAPPRRRRFTARLTHLDGKQARQVRPRQRGERARARPSARSQRRAFAVAAVERRQVRRNPPPPFTTSTLQQEASRKLGFGASRDDAHRPAPL